MEILLAFNNFNSMYEKCKIKYFFLLLHDLIAAAENNSETEYRFYLP